MLIFPKPYEMTVFEGKYVVDKSLVGCGLAELFEKIKCGADGVRLCAQPLYGIICCRSMV